MKNVQVQGVLAACLVACLSMVVVLTPPADAKDTKRYMLEGIAAPEVFGSIIKKPQDRGPNAKGLIAKAGCKLLDYYVGIHNYKNYVIVECTADANFGALQIVLFGSGAITSATATEIVTSAELKQLAVDAGKISGAYGVPK